MELPPGYREFLAANDIDPRVYDAHATLPRYVRIVRAHSRPASELAALAAEAAADAGCAVTPDTRVPGFLRIADARVRLAQLRGYRRRDLAGIDISSGAAAWALGVRAGHNVLDLCCAPGAKLLLLSELVGAHGSVTGVDVAAHRLASCRAMVRRHASRHVVRLFLDDGTAFARGAPQAGWWDPQQQRGFQQNGIQQNDSPPPWFAARLLRSPFASAGAAPYDRVLVDAECTHDGSLAHVHKHAGADALDRVAARAAHAPALQLQLLENGWRLLRARGVLVYSTCSLTTAQNELVLARFLAAHPPDQACVEPLPLADLAALPPRPVPDADVTERMRPAARLDPRVSDTSGMFIARIRKLK
ncbi:hypothetical protein IWW55_002906 [Coemansia sp. RSA 2706]|nr:hypothetical protein LPJ70_006473 [Coemansia sp. RSA 2708]KAJ2303480.1 hypothetical protein IWW55_002906 [Coemansia sp. RSA 2706]KAJ2321015.1 hypothetical protein IWW52_001002 [Coemansia sp. RSA 2704]KAJ2326615.1 hypothetical protein IWW51_002181 [Coemansia sp. RSA 2702]KAJ2364455.1 hypothetical protein H4S01_003770 [Coemansia sp. RSA 2610]KAJ2389470.1 hypothetical protein H4S02_002348 [Coemansia sp. RSA 2611]KAJ2738118.1 hypothetical protein H4R23_001376 [Coemansia sp. Cherry 401B]